MGRRDTLQEQCEAVAGEQALAVEFDVGLAVASPTRELPSRHLETMPGVEHGAGAPEAHQAPLRDGLTTLKSNGLKRNQSALLGAPARPPQALRRRR